MKFLGKNRAIVAATALLMMTGCMKDSGARPSGTDSALSFSLQDIKGQTVSLDVALKNNKAVLLNFWATWCPPCREEIPELIRLQNEYGKSGFTVLGIDVGESPAKVSTFMNKMGMNYPVLLDRDQAVAARYRIVGIPTSYLVSSEGKIIGEYHAATPDLFADVKKALNK